VQHLRRRRRQPYECALTGLFQPIADLHCHRDLSLVHPRREYRQPRTAQHALDRFVQACGAGARDEFNIQHLAASIDRKPHDGTALLALPPRRIWIGLVGL
jgi:hypothetical protein